MREYHHLGVVTTTPRPGEKYLPDWKVWVSGYDVSEYRIEWVRFAPGAETIYPPLVLQMSHLAFRVPDLSEELKGKKCIWGPFETLPGWVVAIIEENGVPVELIQSDLTEEEVLKIVRDRK